MKAKIKTIPMVTIYQTPKILERLYELRIKPWSVFALWLDGRRDGRGLLYYVENQILGWALLAKRRDGKYQVGFFVDPEHRRKGIATKLMKKAIKIVRNYEAELIVDSWDNRSKSFFANFGEVHYGIWSL